MTAVLPEEGTSAQPSPSGGPAELRSAGRRWRVRRRSLPYGLLVPCLVGLGLGLAYPLYRLVIMSTQEYGLEQQFGAPPISVGLDNFSEIFGDSYFWEVLRRSLLFCAVCVTLTLVIGTLVALLLGKLGRAMRAAVTLSLILAWSTPPLSATVVWQWIFDSRIGVVNWALTGIGLDYEGHSWLSDPWSFYMVAMLIVVWGAIPFVAFTLYAAMTQIPKDVMEAAAIDGAGPWQRFRDVTWPGIRPLFILLLVLSTLWDLRVFTQIFVLQEAGGLSRETNLLGTWAFREAVAGSHFGKGAAIAVVMVGITLLLTMFWLRRLFQQQEV
ncbi:MAG: carbohydrate ABC transporter permease [Acidimicrobiales bacterium]